MAHNLSQLMKQFKEKQAQAVTPSPTAMDVLSHLANHEAIPVANEESGSSTTINNAHKDIDTRISQLKEIASEIVSEPPASSNNVATDFEHHQITDKHGNVITLNDKQWQAVELALQGKSFVLIGAAGTGKTTTMKAVFQALFNAGKLPQMAGHGHKYLPENAPGVAISAFTRRATNNIRRNVSEDLASNCITIHKLLEYEPVFYEEYDADKDKTVNKMSFEPARNQMNPLPHSLSAIAFEESSMISVELHREVTNALPHDPQFIYLGDIQQLPPVFGQAILGFKMLELPLIELTEVYRQAMGSPIIKLAHRILSGKGIAKSEYPEWQFEGQLKIHPWAKRISADSAVLTLAKFFVHALDKRMYNPETDAILLPFNKGCGTDELNKHIANKIAKTEDKTVWEVIHGFKKSYFSVGDKVLYDREDALITNIYANPTYSGARAQHESKRLDYWGNKSKTADEKEIAEDGAEQDDVDFLLAQVSIQSNADEDRVRACSHVIELQLLDSDRKVRIDQAGQLNNLILGYAITVHKSQGSEWEKVFLCLHQSHATMLQRELLYTAVTRAKKELFVICEDDSFEKGVKSQRIKGDTIAEKAEYFKGKLENGDLQSA